MGVIVVGVDNSEGARAALRFALEEAKLRGSSLRVVHAWQFVPIGAAGMEAGGQPMFGGELADLRQSAEAAVAATLHAAIPDPGGVDVEPRVIEGTAAAALVEESRGAELLVVGSRGLAGFRGLLLGSVGQQVAHQAACPVVIVPHRREDERAYAAPARSDGYRVLIDRLWPRGVPKTDAEIDEWAREPAPTDKLRESRRRVPKGRLTLVYDACDQEDDDAVAPAEVPRQDERLA